VQGLRASNVLDNNVESSASTSQQQRRAKVGFLGRTRFYSRTPTESQQAPLPSHALLRPPVSNESVPMRRTSFLPSQASLMYTLYGAHGQSVGSNHRFPQDHSRRRRRTRDIPPAPPYSVIDPQPELSVALLDLASCHICDLPSEPCPTYAQAMRGRGTLIQL
jgi:hypothetical protein